MLVGALADFGDALNKAPEGRELLLEAVVEALGNLLYVEGFDRTRRDIANADAAGLILQGEDEAVEAAATGAGRSGPRGTGAPGRRRACRPDA